MFTGIVELKSVYFFNKRVGLTWSLVEAKVYEPKKKFKAPEFMEDPSADGGSWADSVDEPKLKKFAFV